MCITVPQFSKITYIVLSFLFRVWKNDKIGSKLKLTNRENREFKTYEQSFVAGSVGGN